MKETIKLLLYELTLINPLLYDMNPDIITMFPHFTIILNIVCFEIEDIRFIHSSHIAFMPTSETTKSSLNSPVLNIIDSPATRAKWAILIHLLGNIKTW